jgi:RNA polymerase sigma factor (sigma-70 family)
MNEPNQPVQGGVMDERDIREALAAHHDAGFGWAMSCCAHNRAEAEDVLQTAYLKILQGRARFDGRAAFRTWLFAVIRHTAADERRRHWFRHLGLARLAEDRAAEDARPAPAPEPERSERQQEFQAALARLPARQREVLHLVFYQDLTIEAAAEVMGVGVGSARTHYERGKQRLRERIDRTAVMT